MSLILVNSSIVFSGNKTYNYFNFVILDISEIAKIWFSFITFPMKTQLFDNKILQWNWIESHNIIAEHPVAECLHYGDLAPVLNYIYIYIYLSMAGTQDCQDDLYNIKSLKPSDVYICQWTR